MSLPKVVVDQCPWCLSPISFATGDLHPAHCNLGHCMQCGNVLAFWSTPFGIFETSTFDYDWFHKHVDDESRLLLHNEQERRHHEKGHWG